MKAKKKNKNRKTTLMTIAIIVIGAVSMGYIKLLDWTVSMNILSNVQEIADHDSYSVYEFLKNEWSDLLYMYNELKDYHSSTKKELMKNLNIKCTESLYENMYLMTDNGKLYSAKFLISDAKSLGLQDLFSEGQDTVAVCFDDKNSLVERQQELLLMGVKGEPIKVNGLTFVALVAATDIGVIQENFNAEAFYGKGYSSVIDTNGQFVVNIKHTSSLNQRINFFSHIFTEGSAFSMDTDTIYNNVQKGETFTFEYTDKNNIKQVVYLEPLQSTNWYFVMELQRSVFTAQNQVLLLLSLGLLVIVIFILLTVIFVLNKSSQKMIMLEASAQAKTEFLSNMSHQIRTPLNGLIGLNHLMHGHITDQNKMKEYLSKSQHTANYLLSLINDILDISKLQSGKIELANKPVDLEILLDDVWTMQHDNFTNHNINFQIDKNIIAPVIVGDEAHIKHIIMNILGNAIKFTSADGQITLTATQQKENGNKVATTIKIADTGCGMSKEFLEHIWDSFSQEHPSNTKELKGTGLGMAISKLLIDAMGGEITAESELGTGSTFTVVLHSQIAEEQPTKSTHHKALPEMEMESNDFIEEKTIHVLLAEDIEINAVILIEILEQEGYVVTHAENGKIAVELFSNSKPYEFDIILMDMNMPIMDGCQASRAIRELDRPDAKSITICACTANTFKEDRDRAAESGMNDFLSKPIDVKLLLKKIGGLKQC